LAISSKTKNSVELPNVASISGHVHFLHVDALDFLPDQISQFVIGCSLGSTHCLFCFASGHRYVFAPVRPGKVSCFGLVV
jgi:hypothetical protein